jgi:putative ABC transport system permease protein
MSAFFRELRIAFRRLRENPGFTAVAVITLTFGIGANTIIFSLVNTVVLHPLPYPQADRLVRIDSPYGEKLSPADAAEIRSQSHALESVGACVSYPTDTTLTGAGVTTRLKVAEVSPEVFPVLGVSPLFGRTFLAEETTPDRSGVVLLSYSAWRNYLDSDRGVIGNAISLDKQPYTIVGVMPPGFGFPTQLVDVWTPMSATTPATKKGVMLPTMVVGRLKPGVRLQQAQAELNVIAGRMARSTLTGEKRELRIASLEEQTVGPVKKGLLIPLGAVGLVLLLACSNVANLLVAGNARRRREIAVRAALGASRSRLVRQLVAESLLLALLGGCLGLAAAPFGIHIIRPLAPPGFPRLDNVGVDGWVLTFTFLVSLLTGIVFGILPAFAASKPDLIASLKEGSMTSRAAFGPAALPKAQGVLTACQVALATILMIGAGLVVRSLSRLMSVHLGFDPRHLLVVRLSEMDLIPLGEDAIMLFYQRVLDEVNSLPCVESAALVQNYPIGGPGVSTPVFREGESKPLSAGDFARMVQDFETGDRSTPLTHMQSVSSGYFATMRIPILKGRAFTDDDRYGSPFVTVVNESLARRFWPHGDGLGKKIDVGGGRWCEVVGVAGDTRDISLEKEPGPEVYVPNLQDRSLEDALVIRTIVEPQSLGDAVVSRIWAVNKNEGVPMVATMDELISKSVIGPRFHAALFSLFAFLALLMATVGVYGVVSYSVSRRTHEFGIRMALGAGSGDILRLVIRQQMMMTALGVAIGLGIALGLTRAISSLLYGVAPNDLGTFAGVPILLGLAALGASYLPARRALGVDPVNALREE